MISFHPDWHVMLGLAVTVVLGLGVGCLVRHVGDSLPLPPPSSNPEIVALWTKLTKQNTGGSWIGRVELPIFFAVLWLNAWWLISGWLLFKLGFYWQSANFAAFPDKSPDAKQLEYLVSKRDLGTHHVATALFWTV